MSFTRDRVFVLLTVGSSAAGMGPGTKKALRKDLLKEGWIAATLACHVAVTFSELLIRNKT